MIILFHRKVHEASVCLSNKLFLENFNSSDVLRYTKRRKISPLGRNFLKSDRINHIIKGGRSLRISGCLWLLAASVWPTGDTGVC